MIKINFIFMTINTIQQWYEHYNNQVWQSSNEELLKELGYLNSFDENDVEYIMIEKEVKTKVNILLAEINRRWLTI